MSPVSPASRTLFVYMPVADVERTKAFFVALGFDFDPAFSGENAACMTVDEHALVMFSNYETFAQYSHRPAADPATHALALYSFTVPSRDEVDTVAAAAAAAGATEADGPEDHGFMYSRSFFDLDGHGWQIIWTNPDASPTTSDVEATAQHGTGSPTEPTSV